MRKDERLRIRAFNERVPIMTLLQELGAVQHNETLIFCPFHMDEVGGHRSGHIIPEANLLKCYSESKVYRAYDVLKLLKKKIEDYDHIMKYVPPEELEERNDFLLSFKEMARKCRKGEISIPALAEFVRNSRKA